MTTLARRPWRPAVEVIDLANRTPPSNPDAEAACLATILLRGAPALDDVADLLGAGHLYSDVNRRIYAAALELHRDGQPVDVTTLSERLRQRDELQAVGGISALARIVDSTPAVAHLRAYAEIVVDLATKRAAIETLKTAAGEGYTDTGPTLAWLDGVEQRIHDLAPSRQTRGVVQAFDLMSEAVGAFNAPGVDGTPTGFRDLDERLGGGMRDGELLVIAGRPGMGKTAFATSVVMSVAKLGKAYDGATLVRPTLGAMLFSLEMPRDQMAARMVCADAGLDLVAYRKRALPPGGYDRMVESAGKLSQMPLWVDDTPAITLMELRAKVRRQQREYDKAGQRLGLVAVDYLQLMRGDGDNREQEIASITRGLKQMAKELRLPVVALAQLSRAVETRSTKDKRPQLSDLRESGAIEQDADVVMFTYRPEYYVADKDSAEARKLKGYAEVIVAKHRNGPTGRVPVTFVDRCARFENRARDAYQESDE